MDIKTLQNFLKIPETDQFDEFTEAALRQYQIKHNINPTGKLDQSTIKYLELQREGTLDSDLRYNTKIVKHYMNTNEYMYNDESKYAIFLHHTAGWDNPYGVIDMWERDTRGPVGTAYVIGGDSVSGTSKYNGVIVECFEPKKSFAWHLGIGNTDLHRRSIGIELCNFGFLQNGKTYTGQKVNENQISKLKEPFRGYSEYHKYSDEQLNSLKYLLQYIGEITGIDITLGLQKRLKLFKNANKAFEYDPTISNGSVGLYSHTNVSPGKNGSYSKWDVYPQPELIDLIKSL